MATLAGQPALGVQPVASANTILVQFERDRLLAAIPVGTQRILIQTLGQKRPEVAVQALADLLLQQGLELQRAMARDGPFDREHVVQDLAAHQAQALIAVSFSPNEDIVFTVFDKRGERLAHVEAHVVGATATRAQASGPPASAVAKVHIDPQGHQLFINGNVVSLEGPQLYQALGRYDLVEEYEGRRAWGRGLMIGGGVGMAMGLALAPVALFAGAVSGNDDGGATVGLFFLGGAAALLAGIVLPYHPVSAAERAAMTAKHNATTRGGGEASLPRVMPWIGN